jgi:hypothetical protein
MFQDERVVYIKWFTCISKRLTMGNEWVVYGEGEVGDNVYLVLKGSVLLEKYYEGQSEKSRVKRFSNQVEVVNLMPGTLFGYEDIVLKRNRRFGAKVSCSGSIIYEIKFSRFLQFFWKLGNLIENLKYHSIVKADHWDALLQKKVRYLDQMNAAGDWEAQQRENYIKYRKTSKSVNLDLVDRVPLRNPCSLVKGTQAKADQHRRYGSGAEIFDKSAENLKILKQNLARESGLEFGLEGINNELSDYRRERGIGFKRDLMGRCVTVKREGLEAIDQCTRSMPDYAEVLIKAGYDLVPPWRFGGWTGTPGIRKNYQESTQNIE